MKSKVGAWECGNGDSKQTRHSRHLVLRQRRIKKMPFNRKRRGTDTSNASRNGGKKYKYNLGQLLTPRQRQDYAAFGELHPVDDKINSGKFKKVQEPPRPRRKPVKENDGESSDSEEEIPVIKQLMMEMGVKEEEPESEKESSSEEEEEETEENDNILDENDRDDVYQSELDEKCDSSSDDGNEMNGEHDNEDMGVQSAAESESGDEDSESGDEDSESGDDDDDLEEDTIPADDHHTLGTEEDLEKNDKLAESEEDDEEQETTDLCLKESDPFTKHFEIDHDFDNIADAKWKKSQVKVSGLGATTLMHQFDKLVPQVDTNDDLKKLHVKQKLIDQVKLANIKHCDLDSNEAKGHLTTQQHKLFQVINTYQDLLFTKQTYKNTEQIRLVYCLHALNHILKARNRVMSHNASLKVKEKSKKKSLADDDVEYRDQGLTRPRVLILLPYRDRALKVVNMFITLLSSSKVKVDNQKRFEKEFTELEDTSQSKAYKPDDFKRTFEGNIDDNFRIGLTVSKNTVRLYSKFYDSDIILASPLGLREVIGLEGDKDRDFDFLSSIEVCLVDQADIFPMQNWDHFIHVMKHLHLQPKEYHDCDFSRVRMWAINGWSKFYRQTVIFSSVLLPEILTVFNKMCHNYCGKLLVNRDTVGGSIQATGHDAPQFFHRVHCESPSGIAQREAKFQYFKEKIIPYHTSAGIKQTLIYCSYYSFVMLRNYFRHNDMDYRAMNEYDKPKDWIKARIHFRKRHPHFMLYTERLHFHYRFRLRAIHHIIWFDLPQFPVFYPEIVNTMHTKYYACTSTALFTRFEGQKLMEVVGHKQAAHMMNSEKNVNMITVS